MKRKWLRGVRAVLSFAILTLLSFPGLGPDQARATAELDRQFALETVGVLRAWDNVDGLFGDYVADAYNDWFADQSRFRIQDLGKADAILKGSKTPYNHLIDDAEVLGQVARSLKAETILRTKIYKEGARYRFVINWLHSPKMDQIAEEIFSLEESKDAGKSSGPDAPRMAGLGDVRGSVRQAMSRLVRKLPFVANVTGRDNSSITVNVGASSGLKKGDLLIIGTIDDVKRHPLLKSIVDWRMTRTGRAEVEDLEDSIAFARVGDEEEGRTVARFQKVLQIIPVQSAKQPETIIETNDDRRARELAETPRLGYVAGSVLLGRFSRQHGSTVAGNERTGGGFLFGAKAQGQLWLTREWFAELGLAYGLATYSQTNSVGANSPANAGGMNLTQFKIAAGYTYFTTSDLFGPKGWVKMGFSSSSYSLLAAPSDFLGPMAFRGLFLGVGGELPIRGGWGAVLSIDFGLLSSASQSGFNPGAVQSSSDVGFFGGAFYRAAPRMTYRLGFDIDAHSADFTTSSVTHRKISFGPSLLYYF